MITDLRASVARYQHDPDLRAFIDDLRAADAEFAALWQQPVVGFHQSERKTILHPELGTFEVDCDILTVPGSDLRLVVYTAVPNSEAAEKLRLLSVVGLQAPHLSSAATASGSSTWALWPKPGNVTT